MTTRERLIEVATELLDEGGPAAVTLREVGRRSGLSRAAPYRHFADKEALLAALAERELAGRLAESGVRPASARRQALAYVRWALRHPARFRLLAEGGSGAAARAARARLTEAVAAEQHDGRLPPGDPERLAWLVLALAHGAADLAIAGQLEDGNPEALVEDLFPLLEAAVEPPL